MKPNFALNLSHEGISLLHRAQAGWLCVGDVSLDNPALADELSLQRKTATDLEAGGLTTKLVIPNSQILYTDIDAPGPQTADRIGQIRDGLVGLTPYDVNDLVFDWRMKSKVAQVAVVARETLHEAESFATKYRFNPVSFVAVPTKGAFEGEPFFGPTRHAATLLTGGETVQPDKDAIHILGTDGAAPKPKPAAKPKPAPGPKAAVATIVAGTTPAPPSPMPPEPEVEEPAPAVTFTSRRANGTAVAAGAFVLGRIAPRITLAQDTVPPEKPAPPAAPAVAIPASPTSQERTPMAVMDPGTAPADPAPEKRPERHRKTKTKKTLNSAKAATTALAGTLGKLGRRAAETARLDSAKAPSKLPLAPIPAAPPLTARTAVSEAEAMTVFGARGQTPSRGVSRYLGLVLTLLLLLALAIMALWSTYFMSDVTSGWFGTFDEDTEIAATVSELATPVIVPPAPIVQFQPEADGTGYAIPAVSDSTPDATPEIVADPPAALETPQSAIDAAVETALLGPVATTPEPETSPEPPLTVTPLEEPQVEAPLPEADTPAPVVRMPLTRPEAETRYAASGIWQLDPDPSEVPGTDRLDDLYIASIDLRIGSQDAITLPNALAEPDDLQPSSLAPPVPMGTRFNFDERGLVRATSEGALTPDGVQVFQGPPPVAGHPRPADIQVPEQGTRLKPETDRFRPIRPPLRPGNPAEGNERARPGGFLIAEPATIRPRIRPASFQQPETTVRDPEETVAVAPPPPAQEKINNATALAVNASRIPSTRPSGFASPVEKALQEANTPQKPTARRPEPGSDAGVKIAAAAPRMPPVPSRASVAKQATVTNAINLGKVNLIGVYDSPSQRRALVRLPSGRYIKVKVGDRVDGGQVAAIGDGKLRYVKRGRNITLKLPNG